jgi:peptide/nickel transport system substrate-binding protein
LRKGLTFLNGKAFDADDVIESLNKHVAKAAKLLLSRILPLSSTWKRLTITRSSSPLKLAKLFPFLQSGYCVVKYAASRADCHYNDGSLGWCDNVGAATAVLQINT